MINRNKSQKHSVASSSTSSITEDYQTQLTQQEMLTEDFDNMQLEYHPLNILFFLKKVDDGGEIIDNMNRCIRYIFEKQQQNKIRMVHTLFVENWVYKQLPEGFFQQQYTRFERWPIEETVSNGNSVKEVIDQSELPQQQNLDYIITIGGDGTILLLMSLLQEYEKHRVLPPIITFSSGSLNYLGNFDTKEYKKVLDAIVVKRMTMDMITIDARMRLQISLRKQQTILETESIELIKSRLDGKHVMTAVDTTLSNGNNERFEFQALNEITIMRNNENMAQIEIYINDTLLTTVQGDGILIATPTGSTAYNLSCGGSIVHHSAQVFCITPIAPHSLSFRPIILPAHLNIKIRVPGSSRTSTKCTIDGHLKFDMNPEDYLMIKRSPFNVQFVRWSHEDQEALWSARLYKSLKWNKQIVQKPLKKIVEIKAKL